MASARLGLLLVVVLAVAGAATGIWFAVSRDDGGDAGAGASVELVLSNADEFYGRRVAVQGSVAGSFTPNTFTLGEPQPGPEDLLVIRYGKPVQLEQNAVVNVVGVVRRFRLADADAKLDLSEVDAGLLQAFEGKPVVVADEIAIR